MDYKRYHDADITQSLTLVRITKGLLSEVIFGAAYSNEILMFTRNVFYDVLFDN